MKPASDARPLSELPQFVPAGLSPATIDAVYGFSTSVGAGAGKTVALVDAFDDAGAASDLNTFSTQYGLPQCNTSNPCFTRVDQSGGTSYPVANAGWDLEISLDVEWVHALAPAAKILLVEATDNSFANLVTAEQYAAAHATYVSNSWGSPDFSGESSFDSDFSAAGVSYFASSGDTAAVVSYPASSPNVVGVGGTSLTLTGGGAVESETAWSGGGGGCSTHEAVGSAQSGYSGYSGAGCAGKRATPDVAMDGDPDSGVAVFDSVPFEGNPGGWWIVGGTSASTVLFASESAVLGSTVNAHTIYATSAIPFRDITSGSNGHAAIVGYDLVTGIGSWSNTPGAPTLAAATVVGGVSLSWTPTTGAAPTQYEVLRGTSPGAESLTPIFTTAATSYTDTTTAPGTTYSYVVIPANASGPGPYSNEASATPTQLATTLALTSSLNPSAPGQTVTYTATVTPAPNGGTVLFIDDGSPIPGCESVAPVSGVASCTLSGLALGVHGLLAFYDGTTGYGDTISPPLTENVQTPADTFKEFPVPLAGSEPLAITAGPDGDVWFTEQHGDEIGHLTPAGTITEYSLGIQGNAGTLPQSIAAGPDGNLWFTQNVSGEIGRITPSGTITEFPLPDGAEPLGIVAGPDGNLWFTENGHDSIGRITPSGTITHFPIPTADSGPTWIAVGPDGNLWFTEQEGNAIGKITSGGTVTEYPLTVSGSQPIGIAAGPDGNVWFTEGGEGQQSKEKIGVITPSGTITEYPLPAGVGPAPTIAPGADGNLWFSEPVSNGVGRITPSGTISSFPAPTPSSSPLGIAAGPDGSIWFTEESGDKVGEFFPGVSPAVQQRPTQSGTGLAGAPVTCQPGTWTSWAGRQPSTSAHGYDGYRWLLDGSPIAGQTTSSFTPSRSNVGHQLSCQITATYPLLDVTVTATSASRPVSAVDGSILAVGQLATGESLVSPNGAYRLVLQGDGNLVEYGGATPVWATGTNPAGAFAIIASDGDFIVYSDRLTELWSSGTAGNPGAYVELTNAGRLEVVSAAGLVLWSPGALAPSSALTAGQSILSPNGAYRLTMQGDGNLVEYHGATALWATGTNPSGVSAEMQADGNLVVHGTSWTSGTAGNPGAYLALSDAGRLELVSAGGVTLWGPGILAGGSSLTVGQSLLSRSGAYRLTMQADGNLVEYQGTTAIWAPGTNPGGVSVSMQTDGNLVVYGNDGVALWSSGTSGDAGASLLLSDDGRLELVSPDGVVLWGAGVLPAGASLVPVQSLISANGSYRLTMQGDGNLVEYHGATVVWSAHTNPGGTKLEMQLDGNLVVYGGAAPLWASGTSGYPGAALVLTNDGHLEVSSRDGAVLWTS
ncbi:MAG TPA: Ig-like domain repeat protein [Gaiellaceae bacterium]|nr:Ig-like domain repeat protein [Gaiellaceae bacterium]